MRNFDFMHIFAGLYSPLASRLSLLNIYIYNRMVKLYEVHVSGLGCSVSSWDVNSVKRVVFLEIICSTYVR